MCEFPIDVPNPGNPHINGELAHHSTKKALGELDELKVFLRPVIFGAIRHDQNPLRV